VNYLDFGKEINEAWNKEVGHIKNAKERELHLQHVVDWWVENRETLGKNRQSHQITLLNTMRNATDQFTGLVRS
jgi:hypothetical protein